jgi:hypothetical protein
MSELNENQKCLSQIVGEQLSGVNFVMDYLQLQFNDLSLTVLTPLVVHETNRNLRLGDPFYRDSLCDRITHIVTGVALAEEHLNVEFDDDSNFAISLTDEARAGNEALIFQFREGRDMQMLVLHIT